MALLPETYLSSVCEIKTSTNFLIATGHLVKITDNTLEISAAPEKLPLMNANTTIKVGIYGAQGFQIFIGKVYLSTYDFVRIDEIKTMSDFEKREFFRIQTSIQTLGYDAWMIDELTDKPIFRFDASLPFDICIKDISLGGIYFTSARPFSMEQIVAITLPFDNSGAYFCRTIRNKDNDDAFGYGCSFYPYSNRQSECLCSYIFQKQREMIQRAKQYDI